MKKLFCLFLSVLMLFALCACGGEKQPEEPSASASSKAQSETIPKVTEPATAFAEYGLAAVVPTEATVVESEYKEGKYLDYTFRVAVAGNADNERLDYYNQVLNAMRGASANKHAYVVSKDWPWYADAPDFAQAVLGEYYSVFYFKGETYCEVKLSDKGNEAEHLYRIDIQVYSGDNKPTKG